MPADLGAGQARMYKNMCEFWAEEAVDEDFRSEEEKEEEDIPDSDFDEPVSGVLAYDACMLHENCRAFCWCVQRLVLCNQKLLGCGIQCNHGTCHMSAVVLLASSAHSFDMST
eukprot:scaffold268188_cov26-Tisochrysis_lutea.AAC.1